MIFVYLSALWFSLTSCHCNIHCIIRSSMPKLLYCINNVCWYQERLLILLRDQIVCKPLSCCRKVPGIVVVPLSLLCLYLSVVYQSFYLNTIYWCQLPNFISSEYLVDDRWIHPPLVNFSYRRAYQSALLITDAYIYIHCWSTFPIDKSITCQNAKKKRIFYII